MCSFNFNRKIELDLTACCFVFDFVTAIFLL